MGRARLLVAATVLALLGVVVPGAEQADAAGCRVRFATSQPHGRWFDRGLWVDNNMWNSQAYAARQTLRACSSRRWRVTASASNSRHDWAVKSYPNVHRDWHDWSTGAEPPLARLRAIRASFRTSVPSRGIHNTAFDIWLDGVPGVAGVHEVMIWSARRGLDPLGRVVNGHVRAAGRAWTLWANRDGSYVALVPHHDFHRGTVRVLAVLHWLTRHGWVRPGATLGQIGFGFEIVATGGRRATFRMGRFALYAR